LRIDLLLPLDAGDRALTVGVSFNQAGVDGKALAADQAGLYAGLYDPLEDAPEDIALPKALIASAGEC